MSNFARAFIYSTTACQFNCEHCFVREERKKLKPMHIDLSLVEQFITDFYNPKYGGFKTINITGVGNPLLYPKLDEMIALLRRFTAQELSINCRGAISPRLLSIFKTFNVVVYYSMDYFGERADEATRHDGLWNEQVDTLRKMILYRIPVRIRTTIMRDNISDCLQLMGMVQRFRARGADIEWHGMPYIPYYDDSLLPTAEQMAHLTTLALYGSGLRIMHSYWTCIYSPFRDRAKRWWDKVPRICEAGREWGRICLTHEGKILPCPFEDIVLAQYYRRGNEWTFDRSEFEQNLSEYLKQDLPEFCSDCRFKSACKGGCRIHQRLTDKCVCPKFLW